MIAPVSNNASPERITDRSKAKDSKCLKISKMILAASPSIIFGAFTIAFTLQQNFDARENRKQDQQQADERSIRATFENYIDDISSLLLDQKFNRSNPEHLLHIRVKIFTVLRHVDANHRRDIILFLYESRLLQSDMPTNERLNLVGASLQGVQFIGSPATPVQLDHLFLPGVYASNAIFYWCQLDHAVFDNDSLSNIKMMNSTLSNVSFRHIYAPDAVLGDLTFHRNNFIGAILVRVKLAGGLGWKERINMTNIDILDAYDPNQYVLSFNTTELPTIDIRNSRNADGSFWHIDISELIMDGEAEEGVRS